MNKEVNPQDPETSAQLAGLIYVSDADPGIKRRRAGKGFMYISSTNKVIPDGTVKKRIQSLAIPPAYKNVWICSKPNGHIQATGIDDQGRKQYIYHPEWENIRRQTKYHRMLAFGQSLPKIRRRIKNHLKDPNLSQKKVIATIIALLEKTMIRIGNEQYMKDNQSYGLTTLMQRHIVVEDEEMHFHFKGKRGIKHEIHIEDDKLVQIVNSLQELPGQQLFKYQDENGDIYQVTSTDINKYLQNITGENFSAKDFRTWKGTAIAYELLLKKSPCDSEKEANKNITEAVKLVAEKLGNTPSVSKSSYIHPALFEVYRNDLTLTSDINENYESLGLRKSEALVMTFLEKHNQSIGN